MMFVAKHFSMLAKTNVLIHTGEKYYKCEVCGKTFSLAGHLKSHVLTHTEEKNNKCEVCGKTFSLANILKQHVLTHTGKCDKNVGVRCGVSEIAVGRGRFFVEEGCLLWRKGDCCGGLWKFV